MSEENKTEMKDRLFRKEMLQRISSPEELNDYIKVANPGVWLVLAAIAFLLAGTIVWCALGEIETKVDAVCIGEENKSVCYVSDEESKKIKNGMILRCEGKEYTVEKIDDDSQICDKVLSEYEKKVGNFEDGEWIRKVLVDNSFDKGVFEGEIIVESINPLKFIIN